MSEFAEWFEQQHGPRPFSPRILDEYLEEIAAEGRLAESKLQKRRAWDARRESALYAWQAADKEEGK